MTEITKLAVLLAKEDIPFELYAFDVAESATVQIACPSKEDMRVDAVSHHFSYGGDAGLIEVMGSINPDEPNDDVVGWLTAEEAVKYFRQGGNHG